MFSHRFDNKVFNQHTAAGYKFGALLHYFGVDASHSLWSSITWFD